MHPTTILTEERSCTVGFSIYHPGHPGEIFLTHSGKSNDPLKKYKPLNKFLKIFE